VLDQFLAELQKAVHHGRGTVTDLAKINHQQAWPHLSANLHQFGLQIRIVVGAV
jgi:hypothetical protein